MIDDGAEIVNRLKKPRPAAETPAAANGQAEPAPARQRPGKKDAKAKFYDQARSRYWSQSPSGEWHEFSETQFSRLLRHEGLSKEKFKGFLNEVEAELLNVQRECSCHFAGELAGFLTGLHHVCGFRVFVPRGPRLIKPAPGAWPTLRKFLTELLGQDVRYFHGWLKSAFLSLKAGPPFRPGQAIGFAGPSNCGKSLLQKLITELLGGREGKPYKFLIDKTEFNRDLFRAEHLQIEDDVASTDIRARRHFAAALKGLVANETHAFHPKGKDAVILTPFWRISISVNDDADHLMVLPPLDTSLQDKLILLRATPATMPFREDDLDARRKFRSTLSAEMPAYLYWLRTWTIPEDIRDQRFGVKGYQQEDLTEALRQLEPEQKMWSLIQALGVVPRGSLGWKGTAAKLEIQLKEKDRAGEIARLCYYNSALGVYLEKLSRHFPDNVIRLTGKGHVSLWHLIMPDDYDEIPP